MRKILLTLVSALLLCANFNAMAATINGGQTFYLNPGPWNVDGAWFAMHLCNGDSPSQWVKMTDEDGDGRFVGIVPNGQSHKQVIFVRMDKSKTTLEWNSKWNQTNDLDWDGAKTLYTITGWGGGDGYWDYTLPTTVELRGDDNNWTAGKEVMTKSDAKFTLTSTLTQGKGFKIVIDGNWYGTGAEVNSGTTYIPSSSGGNSTWKGATGKVDIVVDFNTISAPKLTITEVVVATPAITSFTAEPAEITLGESVTLTSTTENTEDEVVYTVKVDGNDEVITSPWKPDAEGTYTITASLEGAAESKTATVIVNPVPAPELVSFTAEPSTIVLGEEVTFTCEVENADAADVEYTIDGNKITSPWTPGAVGTYEVTATLAGAAETKTAIVEVTAAPEEITWTFYYIGSKTNVHAYVWDKKTGKKYAGTWPGTSMTDNNGTWEFTFTTTDVLAEPMVIFNEGNNTQTGDLVLENGATYKDNGKVDLSEIHTVYFINNEGWDAVNVYAWNKETNATYLGEWPGSAATLVEGNVWKYTHIGSDINGAGLIFNNGSGGEGNQSYDLTWKDDAYYQYEGEVNKPVEEEAGFYFVTGTNDNWNECLAMTTTDGNIYTYTGPLKGGFKFRLYKENDKEQYGANNGEDLQIEIGKTYGLKHTSNGDAKTFTTPNEGPINVTVEVNRALNTVRVLPADVYIAGSAVVEKYEASDVGGGSTGWGVSTIQGCDVDMASGKYTWTGYLYDDNGDGADNSRFKFLLGSGFKNGGHLIPTDGAITDIEYGKTYGLSFVWDVELGGGTGDQLFHSNGFEDMATYDDPAYAGATRVKVKAVVDLKNMTVTFEKVEEEAFTNIFIAGNATEYGVDGRGALEPITGENGEAVYTAVVNFVNADRGFLFPTTEEALHPAFVAREDGKVTEHFALQGLDYSFATNPIDNQFKVPSAGVYKVEVRPDFHSLYVLPYESTSPADGTYLTVAEKTQTETMTVTFFEKVSEFDASKVKISPETWWMSHDGKYTDDNGDKKVDERKVLNKGISGGTVSFGVNSYDRCLTTGETYTITFEQGAVKFAAKGLAERVSPKFSFTVTLAPDTSIGTGIEGVTAENGIAYKHGIVTAEGTIVVYNMSGAVVARGENEVDLNGMNGGVYIVRCNDNVSKVVR